VARQVNRLLEAGENLNQIRENLRIRFYTSADPASMKSLLPLLLGHDGEVEAVMWKDDQVTL
jgi:glutamate racemase